MLDPLADALSLALTPIISGAVHGLSFSVLSVPSISLPLAGKTYNVSISQARTLAGDRPEGALLLVTGDLTFISG